MKDEIIRLKFYHEEIVKFREQVLDEILLCDFIPRMDAVNAAYYLDVLQQIIARKYGEKMLKITA